MCLYHMFYAKIAKGKTMKFFPFAINNIVVALNTDKPICHFVSNQNVCALSSGR